MFTDILFNSGMAIMAKTRKFNFLSIIIIIMSLLLLNPCLLIADEEDDGVLPFRGKVVYLDFDGGFWGVVTDNGKKYYFPKGLDKEFEVNGQAVEGQIRKSDIIRFHTWGELVELVEITKIQ